MIGGLVIGKNYYLEMSLALAENNQPHWMDMKVYCLAKAPDYDKAMGC